MTTTMTISDFSKTINDQAGALASAWSTMADKFAAQVAAEGGQAVVSAQRQFELLAQSLGGEIRNLAWSTERWAAAAAAEGNAGIASIMTRYAENYAAKANALLDPVLSAEARIGALAAEAKLGVQAAESALGGSMGRALGPAYDAYQMTQGALDWGSTGNSASFGQAAMGVATSWAGGILLGGFIAAIGFGALGVAVAAGIGAGFGALLGSSLFDGFNAWASKHTDFWDALFGKFEQLSDFLNTNYLTSRTFFQRSDPLTLDLDGDGLETIGIDPAKPILFDHDGDGVKTASGWVKSDDAFLVFDRNGNGSIDSGRELFGDSTALYAGGAAADGFAALAQEDSNGDGLVNAADAHWSSLRLWRDLNQDGISQTGELFTLASQNIAALKVAKTANSQTLANGNQIADLGGYVKTDGSTGTLGEVTGLGDINLASNPFYSEFTDHLTLTDAARGLADMRGAGMVRDLREAASLDAALVTRVTGLTTLTRAQMMTELDGLLAAWAGTSTMNTSLADAAGKGYTLAYLPPGMSVADYFALKGALSGGSGSGGTGGSGGVIASGAELARLQALQAQQARLETLIGVLERFNGVPFVSVGATGVTTGQGRIVAATTQPQGAGGSGGATMDGTKYAFVSPIAGQLTLLEQSYAQLKDSVYGGLVLQTRLKPYMDAITLSIDETGIRMDFSAMEAANDFEWRATA